jgi:hypothetical protein
VACDGAVAGTEDRRETATAWREAMANREHGGVDATEAPYRDSVPDRLVAHADRAQLVAADDTVLPLQDVRHPRVGMARRHLPLYYPMI